MYQIIKINSYVNNLKNDYRQTAPNSNCLKTDKNIYLTGKAGTGKTTFLKYIKKCCEIQKINYITLAPTGIASINCGGQTIHSFFKLHFLRMYQMMTEYVTMTLFMTKVIIIGR